MNPREAAWAAGFFEGEGYIGCVRNKRELRMSISQTDLAPLERFHAAVGERGRINGPYQPRHPGHSRYWTWATSSWRDALDVSAILLEVLSDGRKRTQIETAIALFQSERGWGTAPGGRRSPPSQTYSARWIRAKRSRLALVV